MAQFTVNAQRFDPYKNFKFRVKWDMLAAHASQREWLVETIRWFSGRVDAGSANKAA